MELEAHFNRINARKLLHNKFVVFLGDSVQRACYKDLIVLLQENRNMSEKELRSKGESTIVSDKLVETSKHSTNNSTFKEIREYKTDHHLIRFYFITRVYNNYVELILNDFEDPLQPTPDVVIINSSVWDVNCYETVDWQAQYVTKIEKLFARLDKIFPVETCIIWRNALPVGNQIKAKLLLHGQTLKNETLPADIVLTNILAHVAATKHKYDVIDMFYHFIPNQNGLAEDGLHWNTHAHRKMTNILLIHISKAWLLGLPEKSNILDFSDDNFNPSTYDFVPVKTYGPKRGSLWEHYTDEEERYGGPIEKMNTVQYQEINSYSNTVESIPSILGLYFGQKDWDPAFNKVYNQFVAQPLFQQQRLLEAQPLLHTPRPLEAQPSLYEPCPLEARSQHNRWSHQPRHYNPNVTRRSHHQRYQPYSTTHRQYYPHHPF